MPMQKFSTLIYCVSHVQSDVDFQKRSKTEKMVDGLERNEMGPSEESIRNIMNFARSYDVIKTKAAGFVEMILN